MTGLSFMSYVVAPAVMLASALGCGLLARRASGRLAGVLVLPVGFALVVVVTAFLSTWDVTAEIGALAIVVLALAGLPLERRRLRARLRPLGRWAWPALSAALPAAAFAAPAVLTGRATFTGYARITDIANQFDFTRYLVEEGRVRPPTRDTSFLEVVTKTLDIGYPGGAQSALGSFSSIVGLELPWIYQGFLAVAAAMLGLAVYGLLGAAVGSRPLRAVGAGVAAQANVLVGYGLVGGFKELLSTAFLVLAAALAREAVAARGGIRTMLPLAIAAAGALATFNLTIVPWLGLLLGAVAAFALLGRRSRRPVGAWAGLAVLIVVLAAPSVWAAAKLAPVATQAEGADRTVIADLGNMVAPMPVRAAAGVWISGDYRDPSLGDTALTAGASGVVLSLAAIGLVGAVRRRDWALVSLAGASVVALGYFLLRTGPWLQLKAISVTGPVTLALAFAGAGALVACSRRVLRAAGWGLGVLAALGVLAGTANAYHDITVAPTDRLRDLERLGERFAGVGPALYPSHEEYAEYFLRRSDATGMVNPPGEGNGFPRSRPEVAPTLQPPIWSWDLDDLDPAWLQHFKLIVRRRSPVASRPPGNYELAARTRFHEVWRQVRSPRTVLAHLPLPAPDPAASERACAELVRRASDAPAGTKLTFARTPPVATASFAGSDHSPAWIVKGEGITPYGPGRARTAVDVPWAGTYRLWLRGPTQRELRIRVDGETVAGLGDAWSYPEQWTLVTSLTLAPGRHEVTMERSGGNLEPADGAGGQPVGPVILAPVAPRGDGVASAPVVRAEEVCRARPGLDWIEIVRAGGSMR